MTVTLPQGDIDHHPKTSTSTPRAEIATESGTPVMDEFEYCEGSSYGACDQNDVHVENNLKSYSLWALLVSTHLTVAPLWLKRGLVVITIFVRTVIMGHFLRLTFGSISEWIKEEAPSWMFNVLQPVIGPQSRSEAFGWPPPALIVLASFTFVTLVVHPDGLTWVLLGKIKQGVLSITESLLECSQLLITDYGILPSIIAAFAIAGLIFVLFAMIRTSISPRKTRKAPPNSDKKKKKRRGHARHRSGKSKSAPSDRLCSRSMSSDPSADSFVEKQPSTYYESAPDLAPLTPVSSQRHLMASDEQTTHYDSHPEDNLPETTNGTIREDAVANSCSITLDDSLSGRSRMPSVSTVDTTTMSDDMSCSSKSILSIPSVCAGSTKSKPDKRTPNMLSRRHARGDNSTQRPTAATVTSECPSRWDALKPSHSPKNHLHKHDHQVPAKSSEKQLPLRHAGPHRVHNRKIGRGGPAGSKGPSGGQHTPTRNHLAGSSNDQLHARSPVSPPALERGPMGNFTLPPSPPGLGSITRGLVSEKNAFTAFPSQKQASSFVSTILPPYVSGSDLPTSSWKLPTQPLLLEAFLMTSPEQQKVEYQHQTTEFSTSQAHASVAYFPGSPARCFGFGTGSVKENPFAPEARLSDEQIEADLQALGGQMAGSILDF